MDRRAFLKGAGIAAAGLAAGGALAPASTRSPMTFPSRLGVNLYTVRHILPGDPAAVLRAIADIGYEEVEFAGYHGIAAGTLESMLSDAGLAAPSAHAHLFELRPNFDRWIEVAHTLGHRFLVVPWIDEAERTSLDGYRRIAAELNGLGEGTRAEGIRLAYHNHDFEFETFGGDVAGLEVLLMETDPEVVTFELDIFWTVHGGADPLDLFERFPGRFELLHLKDRTADGRMVDVGAGAIDFAAILAQARQAGVRHAFVEHDEPEDPIGTLRRGFDHLNRLAKRDR